MDKKHEAILAMYTTGKTYKQIGDEFGLTRERVRQILMKYVPDILMELRLNKRSKTFFNKHWLFTLNGRWADHYDACARCNSTEFKHQGHGLCRRCYGKWRYSDPKKRLGHLKRQHESWIRLKQDPDRYKRRRDRERIYMTNYLTDMKLNNPERYNSIVERQKELHRTKMQTDPVYAEKKRSEWRARHYKNKQKQDEVRNDT